MKILISIFNINEVIKMKSLLSILAIAGTLYVGTTQAAEIRSAGQAITLCKTEAMEQNADYVRSKSRNIKETRGGYKLKMKVTLAESTVVSKCTVSRDGTVDYSQS